MLYVEKPEKLNLIGLLEMRILEKKLQDPHNIGRIKKLNASIVITAGEMSITLSFKNSQIKLQPGKVECPDASIEGSVESFFKFAIGTNPIRLLISRQMKISGNLFSLLKIVKLLQPSPSPSHLEGLLHKSL